MHAERPGKVRGELTGEVIADGRFHLTSAVTDGGRRWV
ncbi:acyl-CoA dehydrogenase, partial [Marinitenerispora sediminis]